MTKSFHVGGAARAGLMSALMAKHGYTASTRALEAPRGLMQTYSTKCDWNEITDELGKRFEISFNTYKPFACGIVIHPASTAASSCATQHRLARRGHRAHRPQGASAGARADRQDRAAHRARRQVQRLSRVRRGDHLRAGGRARVLGCRRCAARRHRAARSRSRRRSTTPSTRMRRTSASTCRDGRTLHVFVEHAIGSMERPMSDADLQAKFHGLVDPVLGIARADELIGQCSNLASLDSLRGLIASARG